MKNTNKINNNATNGRRWGRLPFIIIIIIILAINNAKAKAAQMTNWECVEIVTQYFGVYNTMMTRQQDSSSVENTKNVVNSWKGVFIQLNNKNSIDIKAADYCDEITETKAHFHATNRQTFWIGNNQNAGSYGYISTTYASTNSVITTTQYNNSNATSYWSFGYAPKNTATNTEKYAIQTENMHIFDINNGNIMTQEFIPRASSYLDIELNISGGKVNCIGIPWTSYLPDYKLGEFYGVDNPQSAYITFNEIENEQLNEIYNWNNSTWNSEEQWIYVPTSVVQTRKPYVLEYSFDGISFEHYYYYFENIEITEGIYQNESGEWIYGEISGDRLKDQQQQELYNNIESINSKLEENNQKWSGELLSDFSSQGPSGETILNENNMFARIFKGITDFLFTVDENQLNAQLDIFENILRNTNNILNIPFYLYDKMLRIFINYNTNEDFILSWEPIEFQTRYNNAVTLFDNNGENEIDISEYIRENEFISGIYEKYLIIVSIGWIYLFANWMRAIWLDIMSVNWIGNNIPEENVIEDTSTKLETTTGAVETIGYKTPNGVIWKDEKYIGKGTRYK